LPVFNTHLIIIKLSISTNDKYYVYYRTYEDLILKFVSKILWK
jgi:hypothetical protein